MSLHYTHGYVCGGNFVHTRYPLHIFVYGNRISKCMMYIPQHPVILSTTITALPSMLYEYLCRLAEKWQIEKSSHFHNHILARVTITWIFNDVSWKVMTTTTENSGLLCKIFTKQTFFIPSVELLPFQCAFEVCLWQILFLV